MWVLDWVRRGGWSFNIDNNFVVFDLFEEIKGYVLGVFDDKFI